MKETSANIENEVRKYFLSEFSYDDGEYEITFNIGDIAVLKRCAVYSSHKLDSMYKGLIRDVHRNGTITQIYSDGYDYVQTGICFLLEHLGKRLGDMTVRFNRKITIYRKCCCIVNCAIRREHVETHSLDEVDEFLQYEPPIDDIDIEESYTTVDEQIEKMNLTANEKQTLDCYMGGMRFVEIAKFLSVDLSTVWRRRASIKRKYISLVGL